jgi:hypothetical protein
MSPSFRRLGWLISPGFRRRVLDLLRAGRKLADVARDLRVDDQMIDDWRRQDLIDTGQARYAAIWTMAPDHGRGGFAPFSSHAGSWRCQSPATTIRLLRMALPRPICVGATTYLADRADPASGRSTPAPAAATAPDGCTPNWFLAAVSGRARRGGDADAPCRAKRAHQG